MTLLPHHTGNISVVFVFPLMSRVSRGARADTSLGRGGRGGSSELAYGIQRRDCISGFGFRQAAPASPFAVEFPPHLNQIPK